MKKITTFILCLSLILLAGFSFWYYTSYQVVRSELNSARKMLEKNKEILTVLNSTKTQQNVGKLEFEIATKNESKNWNIRTLKQKSTVIKNLNIELENEINIELETLKSEYLTQKKLFKENKTLLKNLELENNFEQFSQSELGDLNIDSGSNLLEVKSSIEQLKEVKEANQQAKNGLLDFVQKKETASEFVNRLWIKTDTELANMVQGLSLKQKAAQLLVFGFEGLDFDENLQNWLQEIEPGGVILMGSNIQNPDQTKNLVSGLQTASKLPLLVSIDQEGLPVQRITWDPTSGQNQWANFTSDQLCDLGSQRASILKSAGVNVNFSPVADLSYLGTAFINNRTIDSDPNIVSQKIKDYVDCHQKAGVKATLKHFPGHGSTTEDSHFVLPKINKDLDSWQKSDMIPFAKNLQTSLIMIGHLQFSSIDDKPATQSYKIVTELLKNEMGYTGLTITDDMNQLHVSTGIDVASALKNAFQAGLDLVLYVGMPASYSQILNALVNLIETNQIDSKEVNAKLLKVLIEKRSFK